MNETLTIDHYSHCALQLTLFHKGTGKRLCWATGFLYQQDNKKYLITNFHVLAGRHNGTGKPLDPDGAIPDKLTAKYQSVNLGEICKFYGEYSQDEILIHPVYRRNCDVVALDVTNVELLPIIKSINELQNTVGFTERVGHDIFILGYPRSLRGGGLLPIWKRGSIASEPFVDRDNLPYFLVDSATQIGLSGAPVILRSVNEPSHDLNGKLQITFGVSNKFLGVYSGRIAQEELKGYDDYDEYEKNHLLAQLGRVWKAGVIKEIIDGNTFCTEADLQLL